MGSNAVGNRIKRTQNTFLYSVKASIFKGFQREATFYYPIWWGEAPRIMSTYVESYDFDGITVIPFCTSGSSGMGESGDNLAQLAGSGTWLAGERFSGSVSEEELKEWIESLQE